MAYFEWANDMVIDNGPIDDDHRKLVEQVNTLHTATSQGRGQDVVARVRQVTDIVAEISAASNEQSSGIAEVGNAVSLMDQATQQNAALVEQATAAAHSLAQQAERLTQAVAEFKLDAGG